MKRYSVKFVVEVQMTLPDGVDEFDERLACTDLNEEWSYRFESLYDDANVIMYPADGSADGDLRPWYSKWDVCQLDVDVVKSEIES